MNKTMKQYKGKVLKAMMMLLAVGFALALVHLPCLLALLTMNHTSLSAKMTIHVS